MKLINQIIHPRSIAILLFCCLSAVSVAAPEKPAFLQGNAAEIKTHLNEKGKDIFDIVIFTVAVIAGIAYAIAGGLLAYGRPQEARSLGINATAGLVFISLIGAVVSIFI